MRCREQASGRALPKRGRGWQHFDDLGCLLEGSSHRRAKSVNGESRHRHAAAGVAVFLGGDGAPEDLMSANSSKSLRAAAAETPTRERSASARACMSYPLAETNAAWSSKTARRAS